MDGPPRSSTARRLRARAGRAASSSQVCPSSTELPAQGNGLGPAIGVAAAGVVGAAWVLRARALGTAGGRDDA